MRVVVQRVKNASVSIDGKIHSAIEKGYLLLVGICDSDSHEIVQRMAEKISKLRIFEDEQGKMNLSLIQANGAILSVSQFTLYADCISGNRPSFMKAGNPEHAKEMYSYFNVCLRKLDLQVAEGVFAADMKVNLLNDGPVTILLDSGELGYDSVIRK